jgi:hypothetical protein
MSIHTELVSVARHIIEVTNFLQYVNQGKKPEDARYGGYLTILDELSPIPLVRIELGEVPLEKKIAYYQVSLEKAVRLLKCPEHVSSYQSRNPDMRMWGGAIRCSPFIISFSGLPELDDESLSIIIALRQGFLHEDLVHQILNQRGGHDRFKVLYEASQMAKLH